MLANALKTRSNLQILNLGRILFSYVIIIIGSNKFGDKGAEAIIAAVKATTTLKELYLGKKIHFITIDANLIGAKVGKTLSDFLKTNSSITILNMGKITN
jgi:hypothetical protein